MTRDSADRIAQLEAAMAAQQRILAETERRIHEQQAQIDTLVDVVETLQRERTAESATDRAAERKSRGSTEGSDGTKPSRGASLFPERESPATQRSKNTVSARLYCDGGCWSNPGPGGWACIVDLNGDRTELSGGRLNTTNNQMELQALIEGLRTLPSGAAVQVITDSEYLMKGVTSWLAGWSRNGWKTSSGGAVKNLEQWQEIQALLADHPVRVEWVRGHSGHPENERCDELAGEAIRKVTAGASRKPDPGREPTRR